MSASGEFGSIISYTPFDISFFFFGICMVFVIHYASIAVVFFLALHRIIVSCLWFHSMHIIFNPNLLHEGHSLAYTTCVGGNGKFTTAIRDECGISWIFRKCRSGVRTHTGKGNVSLTFWSSGRSRQRKRTASYSSARVGDVRHGSRAIQVRREKGKKG